VSKEVYKWRDDGKKRKKEKKEFDHIQLVEIKLPDQDYDLLVFVNGGRYVTVNSSKHRLPG
jgi:hypothetical protein